MGGRKKYRNPTFSKLYEDLFYSKSDTELAKDLDVSRSTINEWKNGTSFPDVASLVGISKMLHVSVDYLLGLTKYNALDGNIQSVQQYTGLSEKAINALNDKRFQGDLPFFLNGFVDNPLFDKFALYYAHAYGKASFVNMNNKDAIVQERLDYHDKNGTFIMAMDSTLDDLLHFDCDRMCKQFEEFVHYFFNIKVEGYGRTEMIHYDQAEIVESEDE